MNFRTEILQSGKTATGIVVPDEIVTALGAGKKPPVRVTINGHTYRNTIATVSGKSMVGVSAEHRDAAGVKGGDIVDVGIELDTEPRVVAIPPDFAEALSLDPAAREFWNGLSYSNQSRHVLSIEGAKTPETRQRRIAKAIETLQAGTK